MSEQRSSQPRPVSTAMMAMTRATETEILEQAAREGTLEIAEWPRVFENVLQRLHEIVYTGFPSLPRPVPADPFVADPAATQREENGASPIHAPSSSPEQSRASSHANDQALGTPSQPSNASDRDNDTTLDSASSSMVPNSMPPPSQPLVSSSDPLAAYPELSASYKSSINALKSSFATEPPYTIQRLAELVLYPNRHYRYLPPFLNALDRVVLVSSPTTAFPLDYTKPTPNGISVNHVDQKADGLTGDEGLGGALLTPIPWLRHHNGAEEARRAQDAELRTEETGTIQGPNGAGRIETVSVMTSMSRLPSNGHMVVEQELRDQGAVTQGELLRQEQEAGVVPVAQTARRGFVGQAPGPDRAHLGEEQGDEEVPHARGPDAVGVEDLGLQEEGVVGHGRPLDLDAALGRAKSPPQLQPEAGGDSRKEEGGRDAAEDTDGVRDVEGDYVLVDAESVE